jgi:hypothetical protein
MATGAPLFGNVQEFQQENEVFSSYLERIELFFAANNVQEDKKVTVFLTVRSIHTCLNED